MRIVGNNWFRPLAVHASHDSYCRRPRVQPRLEALLSLAGYNVLTAEDGIQALEQFRRNQPDLLLLDVNMPNMRGTEVCRRIKNNPETLLVPLVRITGLTATEDRVTGIQAGADDFLCKPVNREQLIARVRSLLRQKAFTDELERAEAVLFALARSSCGGRELCTISEKLRRRIRFCSSRPD